MGLVDLGLVDLGRVHLGLVGRQFVGRECTKCLFDAAALGPSDGGRTHAQYCNTNVLFVCKALR